MVGSAQRTKRVTYSRHLELKGEGTEAVMSQPPQELPTTLNTGENAASEPTSVQETSTTEEGNSSVEDIQVRRGRAPTTEKSNNVCLHR